MKPGDGVICAKCGKGQRIPETAETEAAKQVHDSSAYVAVTPVTNKATSNTLEGPQEVIIKDIHMEMGSMVGFMVKWAIASIPAAIILAVLFFLFSAIVSAIIASAV